jgi:hypothetical protein
MEKETLSEIHGLLSAFLQKRKTTTEEKLARLKEEERVMLDNIVHHIGSPRSRRGLVDEYNEVRHKETLLIADLRISRVHYAPRCW